MLGTGSLFLLLSTTASAAQTCDAPSSTVELRTLLEDAESAYGELNVSAFKEATDAAEELLPCLAEPLPRSLAASYHRTRGLRLFIERDQEGAQLSFAAARSIEPQYRFPQSLVPEGHPVRMDYGAHPVELGEYLPVAEPAGRITFDGRDSSQRPLSWPTVVQIYDVEGQVTETAVLQPTDPMPAYTLATGQTMDGGVIRRSFEFHPKPTMPVLAGAVGVAVLSGGVYALAARSYNQYQADDTPPGEIDPQRARTNGLVVATWVGGTAAVALGTGAFFVARW